MLFQPWQGSLAEKKKSDRGEFKDVCLYSTALQAQVFESTPAVGPVQVLAVNNASISLRLCVLVSSLYHRSCQNRKFWVSYQGFFCSEQWSRLG